MRQAAGKRCVCVCDRLARGVGWLEVWVCETGWLEMWVCETGWSEVWVCETGWLECRLAKMCDV